MIIKRKGRIQFKFLFPLVKPARIRRDAITGETEKHQTPYPPAYLNSHKNFNNPKKSLMEIDHIDGNESRDVTSNLRWLTKGAHIERTNQQLFPTRRPVKKGAPTRVVGRVTSYNTNI